MPSNPRPPFFSSRPLLRALCRTPLAAMLMFFQPVLAAHAQPVPNRERLQERGALAQRVMSSRTQGELNLALQRVRFHGVNADFLKQMGLCMGMGDALTRQNCSYALGRLAEPSLLTWALQPLLSGLADPDVKVRMNSCAGLGQLKSKDALQPLVERTEDPAPPVRREALVALGRIGDARGGPAVLKRFDDEVPETRMAAILAAGEMRYARGAPKLVALLDAPSEVIRLAAAKSLCRLGRAEGQRVAQDYVDSEVASRRKDGIWLLDGAKTKWATARLVRLLGDPELQVSIAAAKALAAQGDARGARWLVLSARDAPEGAVLALETAIEDVGISSERRKAILQSDRAETGKSSAGKADRRASRPPAPGARP